MKQKFKVGNILLALILITLVVFFWFGGIERFKNFSNTKDIEVLNKSFKKYVELSDKEKNVIINIYSDSLNTYNDSLNTYKKINKTLFDSVISLESTKQENQNLKDSLVKMHFEYMNNSYLKQNFEKGVTYWYVNYSFKDKDNNGKVCNHIINFNDNFSLKELTKKIEKRNNIHSYKNVIDIHFFHQVSQKAYYEWIKFEKEKYNKDYIYNNKENENDRP